MLRVTLSGPWTQNPPQAACRTPWGLTEAAHLQTWTKPSHCHSPAHTQLIWHGKFHDTHTNKPLYTHRAAQDSNVDQHTCMHARYDSTGRQRLCCHLQQAEQPTAMPSPHNVRSRIGLSKGEDLHRQQHSQTRKHHWSQRVAVQEITAKGARRGGGGRGGRGI